MQTQDSEDIEAALRQIWSEVLKLPAQQIPLGRSFFTLGGTSLLVMEVMERVNSMFFPGSHEEGLTLTEFFTCGTIRQLADRLAATPATAPAPATSSSQSCSSAMAIIGLALRVPGAGTPEEFWHNLRAGVESLEFFSEEELLDQGATVHELSDPHYVRCAGLVDEVQCFDAEYFGLTPVEAALTAPEQRLLLECAHDALERAGYGARWRDERVGVFTGSGLSTYLLDHLAATSRTLESAAGMRMLFGNTSPATRLSYLLNLTGPSVTIDTACSSSLIAVHHACRAIANGECEMALAGGATVRRFGPRGYRAEEGGILSPDGHCRPFDRRAQGTVATSGAGMVLLKRLDSAIADGDPVYACIRGTAINNDGGGKSGYTAPSAAGQAAVIGAACAAAGVDLGSIRYVESHGTATALGDAIEVAALSKVFGSGGRGGRCALGTLKANVGHLEAAAGIASLIKVALALQHREIPPAIHFREPNPRIDFKQTPFYLNRELESWPTLSTPRRAGVSSFGIGGSNAHAVLEEAPEPRTHGSHRDSHLLILSARSPSALHEAAQRHSEHLAAEPHLEVGDVAYSLQIGRTVHPYRRFCVSESTADAARLLSTHIDAGAPAPPGEVPVVFMFPGLGSQHINMTRGIYESEPVFREHLHQCAELLRPLLARDPREIIFSAEDSERDAEMPCAPAMYEPALFAVEYALARLWESWGAAPAVMIGHGVGEYVAACISGVLSLEDALLLVSARGRLMREARGAACSPLETSHSFHFTPTDDAMAEFSAVVERVTLQDVGIPYLSNLTGGVFHRRSRIAPDYWLRHLHTTVEFAHAIRKVMLGSQKIFLEMGPGTALTGWLRNIAGSEAHVLVSSCRPRLAADRDSRVLMQAVGTAWQAGANIDWQRFNAKNACRRVALPTYPFERRRHWVDAPTTPAAAVQWAGSPERTSVAAESAHLGRWFYVPAWKQQPVLPSHASTPVDTCLLFDDGTAVSECLAQTLARTSRRLVRVRAGGRYAQDGQLFVLDPKEFGHYCRLLAALPGERIESIVHAWCLSEDAGEECMLARGFYSLLYLCQAFEERARAPLRITVLTSDAHVILGHEAGSPFAAMLAQCARVISQELPHIRCRSIDASLASSAPDRLASQVEAVIGDAFAPHCEPAVAYRGAARFVPTYEPLSPPKVEPASSLLRDGGTYLITGGLGGIGLTLAEFLGRRSGARIVLTSRSGLPEREQWDGWAAQHGQDGAACIARIRAIESSGAQVLVLRADVTDIEQMRFAVRHTLERFGALQGVVHAAGVPAEGVIALKSHASAREVLAPKVAGTLNLMEAVKGLDLDFFVLCSSIATVFAPAGQFDYCAANAFQDAFAHAHDRAGRTRFVSINWDGWREVGMAARLAPGAAARGSGLEHGISCLEGAEVFRQILESPRPRWIISTRALNGDGSALSGARERRRPGPILGSRSVPERVESGTEEQVLARIWRELLGGSDPQAGDDFFALGGDSLLAIQLRSAMESHFRVSVSMRQLLHAPTLTGMADLLRNAHRVSQVNGTCAG